MLSSSRHTDDPPTGLNTSQHDLHLPDFACLKSIDDLDNMELDGMDTDEMVDDGDLEDNYVSSNHGRTATTSLQLSIVRLDEVFLGSSECGLATLIAATQ